MKCAMDRQDLLYRYAGDEFLILSALEPEQIQGRLNEILEKSPIHFDINGEKPQHQLFLWRCGI